MMLDLSTQKVSSPKISPSPKFVDITDADVQTSTDPQKFCAAKTTISTKTTISDPKTSIADKKSADPKTTVETSKAVKTTTATQTIPQKNLENSKTVEMETKKPTVDKEEKHTQIVVTKEEIIQLGKTQAPFNIQTEISKLKIPIPLTELVKHDLYKSQITDT